MRKKLSDEEKKLTEQQQEQCQKYRYVLNIFYQSKKIWSDTVRNSLEIKFLEAARSYNGEKEVPMNKYLMICLNRAYRQFWWDKIKAAREKKEVLFSELSDEELAHIIDKYLTSYDYKKEDSEDAKYVRAVYKFLTWKQQELVYYKFYCGFKFKEIASLMGTTVQNIKQMYQRIRNTFEHCGMIDFAESETGSKVMNLLTGEVVDKNWVGNKLG